MTRQPGHLCGSKSKNFRGSTENWRTGSKCAGFSRYFQISYQLIVEIKMLGITQRIGCMIYVFTISIFIIPTCEIKFYSTPSSNIINVYLL